MATETEIEKAFNIILGAGIEFAPTRDEIPIRVDSWCELLTDIPGDALIQAAKDIAISADRFPSIPTIRRAAANVKIHNGQSAAPDPFKDDTRTWKIVKGGYRVTAEGWQPVTTDPTSPRQVSSIFPAEVLAELDEIAARTGDGLMSDADFARSDEITAPYLAKAFPCQPMRVTA